MDPPVELPQPRQPRQNPRDPRQRPPGPPPSDPSSGRASSNRTSSPASSNRTSSAASTAGTSELRAMLSQQARKQQGRSKPSLSQVRLEIIKGSRSHYKEWKRTIEAQRALYKLDDAELSMLIYLSCQGEPRQILNQLQIGEMQEAGGLNRVLRLLEESYGARSDERFEEKQEAYLTYRRTPSNRLLHQHSQKVEI